MTTDMRSGEGTRGWWTVLGIIAEWTCLLAALGALTITEEADRYVAVEWLMLAGLAGLAASFAVRWARTGHPIRRTGLDGPWALFLVSAAIAAWISYNYGEAWLKFARILAAAVLYYALADSDERTLRGVAAGFVLAAAGLALYWPTQHDFAAEPGKHVDLGVHDCSQSADRLAASHALPVGRSAV